MEIYNISKYDITENIFHDIEIITFNNDKINTAKIVANVYIKSGKFKDFNVKEYHLKIEDLKFYITTIREEGYPRITIEYYYDNFKIIDDFLYRFYTKDKYKIDRIEKLKEITK
jgi:hypothetical protein